MKQNALLLIFRGNQKNSFLSLRKIYSDEWMREQVPGYYKLQFTTQNM